MNKYVSILSPERQSLSVDLDCGLESLDCTFLFGQQGFSGTSTGVSPKKYNIGYLQIERKNQKSMFLLRVNNSMLWSNKFVYFSTIKKIDSLNNNANNDPLLLVRLWVKFWQAKDVFHIVLKMELTLVIWWYFCYL